MIENFNCNFCKKNFSTKYTLKHHQNTSKKCLRVQNINEDEVLEYKCEYCLKYCTTRYNLENHIKNCKDNIKLQNENLIKEIKEQNDTIKKYKERNYFLKDEVKELKYQYELRIAKLENIIETNEKRFQEYKQQYDKLYQQYIEQIEKNNSTSKEITLKAIENTGSKTTNNTINNRNQIYQALQPLTDDYMRDQAKHLTYTNIKNGAHGIAHFASNFTFKDRLFCSDKSRLNFVFKNEADVIIKDPQGIEITKKFIEINRDEILRLVEEYLKFIIDELNDDCTSGDMYKFWAEKREEFLAIQSAVKKGNVSDNKESYDQFKKNFLMALSDIVPR